ncbi:MAG: T9SS type A sorting domain-containing protein [Chitinophagaceae bacterium]|nr:T9SS type A sorting domain-containing protein [Chitinophagaceae bacterium]
MKKTYLYTLVILVLVAFLSAAAVNYSMQPPFNYTGADGPSTCAQCHANFNNGGGAIFTTGLPDTNFIAGQSYNFNVNLSHPTTRGRWGFSIVARDANNQPVGTFSSSNPNAALNNGELSHFGAVFSTGTSFAYDGLTWTAPFNPTVAQRNVSFYYIGNAANGDQGLTGDFIYSGMKTSSLVIVNTPPAVTITSPANGSQFTAGALIALNATASDADGVVRKVEFYNNGVKFLEDSIAPYGLTSNNEIEPGIYTITAKAFDDDGASRVSDTVRITVTGCTPIGTVTAEGYLNIPGTQVADLLNNPAYPNNPEATAQLTTLQYSNITNQYGARLRGYLCAPLTGNYVFYIAGDDQAGLYLSTDENPANKVLIAYNQTPVNFQEWLKFPTQKSVSIKLVKGGRYYFETLHKQSTGANHLSVGWVMPNGTAEAPIPGNRLSPIQGSGSGPSQQSFQEAMLEKSKTEEADLTISVTPNPSSNHFTLTTRTSRKDIISVSITDISGRLIERRLNIAPNSTVQFGTNYLKGVYFAEIRQGERKKSIKLVKK